jgi:hypothetical protein
VIATIKALRLAWRRTTKTDRGKSPHMDEHNAFALTKSFKHLLLNMQLATPIFKGVET